MGEDLLCNVNPKKAGGALLIPEKSRLQNNNKIVRHRVNYVMMIMGACMYVCRHQTPEMENMGSKNKSHEKRKK